MEMLREVGFCSGIENYSRILDGRRPGDRPYCLIDYFPDDFICFIDESHQTVPQIGGMYEGDRSRKQTLVDYGFRLPSALDNRPQTFEEFLSITPQLVFVSATPGEYERTHSTRVVEQIVRPTGIVDPDVEVRETRNQIDDLMNEVRARVERDERVLVTTLTKKMSEDLSDYLLEMGFKTRYLHSEIDTLERIQIIRDLRLGEYDVLVGVNLLREGLDLPEVSLVAILDADKEGFLRGETSLIQTIGRAARNVDGTVLMYADKETRAMRAAISETDRRREIQLAYNEQHGITAATIVKGISDIAEFLQAESKVPRGTQTAPPAAAAARRCRRNELERMVVELEEEMLAAADELRFEYAAQLRDELRELRRDLQEIRAEEGPEPRAGAAAAEPAGGGPPVTSPRMPPWSSTGRQSNARTSRSAGAAMTRRRSTRTCARSPSSVEELQRTAVNAGPTCRSRRPRAARCRASSRRPRRPPRKSSARRPRPRARSAKPPTATPSARAKRRSRQRAPHVAAVAQVAATLLERVGAMDAEVRALAESLRAGAGRLAARPARRRGAAWASSTTPPRAASTRPGSPIRAASRRARQPRRAGVCDRRAGAVRGRARRVRWTRRRRPPVRSPPAQPAPAQQPRPAPQRRARLRATSTARA